MGLWAKARGLADPEGIIAGHSLLPDLGPAWLELPLGHCVHDWLALVSAPHPQQSQQGLRALDPTNDLCDCFLNFLKDGT